MIECEGLYPNEYEAVMAAARALAWATQRDGADLRDMLEALAHLVAEGKLTVQVGADGVPRYAHRVTS